MGTEVQIMRSTEEDSEVVYQTLRKYNRKYITKVDDYNYHIIEDGKIVAGIVACRKMDTLEIDYLCVDETYRGKGLGSKLLHHVESVAKQDGINRALVFTYSFQAPEFYKRMGYTTLFEIAPCFGGYQQIFYSKELSGGDQDDLLF